MNYNSITPTRNPSPGDRQIPRPYSQRQEMTERTNRIPSGAQLTGDATDTKQDEHPITMGEVGTATECTSHERSRNPLHHPTHVI